MEDLILRKGFEGSKVKHLKMSGIAMIVSVSRKVCLTIIIIIAIFLKSAFILSFRWISVVSITIQKKTTISIFSNLFKDPFKNSLKG